MTNELMTEPFSTLAHHRDEYLSARAARFLNFASALNIDPRTAATYASDALDDPIDYTTPSTDDRDDRSIMIALACTLFNSDDDFDDFTHELDHHLHICDELIAANQHPICCPCPDCDI